MKDQETKKKRIEMGGRVIKEMKQELGEMGNVKEVQKYSRCGRCGCGRGAGWANEMG